MLKMKAENTGGWNPHILIHIAEFDGSTERPAQVVTGLVKEPVSDLVEPPPTPIALRIHDAQLLMDSLWECGLRPSEGAGSAGALAATERHLKDLQRIIFSTPVVVKAEP